MCTFIELPLFSRFAADYFDDGELAELQAHLAGDPLAGDLVTATGGVRKLRWSRPGIGKRGGLRVLYYLQRCARTNLAADGVRGERTGEHRGKHPESPERDRRSCRD